MKFVYPKLNFSFTFSREDKINILVVENQDLFYEILLDIKNQLNGLGGKALLSNDNNPISILNNLEMITEYVPFTINSSNAISGLYKKLNDFSLNEEYYLEYKKIISNIISFLTKINLSVNFDLIFAEEIDFKKLLKLFDLKFDDNLDNLSESLIEYMKIVREFDKEKCFVFVNLRYFINDDEIDEFYKLILYNKFKVLIIMGGDQPISRYEEKIVIDKDLCQF